MNVAIYNNYRVWLKQTESDGMSNTNIEQNGNETVIVIDDTKEKNDQNDAV